MKALLRIIVFLIPLFANSQIKIPVVIFSNKTARIILNGEEFGEVSANGSVKVELTEGEQLIQLQSGQENISKVINCIDSKQKVILFEFKNEMRQNNEEVQRTTLSDFELELGGSLYKRQFNEEYFHFDKGDSLLMNISTKKGRGNFNIDIYEYPSNRLIYSRQNEERLLNQLVIIDNRGIFRITLSTNNLFGRSIHYRLCRHPRSGSSIFNTSVHTRSDTIYNEFYTQVRVFSTTNLHNTNRTIVPIKIPENTAFWTYWIGVGREPMDKMKELSKDLKLMATGFGVNPLYAVIIGTIPSLPSFKTTETINYFFTDAKSAHRFLYNQPPFQFLDIKTGQNITTDYQKVNKQYKDLVLCLENTNSLIGRDVDIRVGLFEIQKTYIVAE